jgi:hypothetical protein
MEDIEDYYTYYVVILGVSEDLFWNADISFLISVLENKLAYDDYVNYVKEVEIEHINKKK